jgi:hypothetical protein
MNFKNWPKVNNDVSGDTVYTDVVTHAKDYQSYLFPGDNVTSVHETTHKINADIRNSQGGNIISIKPIISSVNINNNDCRLIQPVLRKGLSPKEYVAGRINAFYCLKDQAAIIQEANCRKSDAIEFIPQSLKFSRFSTYVSGQQAWDDMPYYLFDEGVAYANGADCVIDMNSRGEYHDKGNDFMFGPVEFLTYLAAVLMAADKANSLREDAIAFANWHFIRVSNIYYAGKSILPWDDMDKCWATLKTGSEAQAIRDFLKSKINFVFPDGPINPDDRISPDDFNLLR